MKRVLVTGATGFVGRWTLPCLVDRGFEVHAVSRRADPPPRDGVTWRRLDLLDGAIEALVRQVRPTHLLHFAWETTPLEYWVSLDNLRWGLARIARVLQEHEPVHQGRWRHQPVELHVKHAAEHFKNWRQLAGTVPAHAEEELAHAACRTLMALELFLRERHAGPNPGRGTR